MIQKKKNILITGASRGLGKSLAMHLVNEGHRVYGGCRNIQKSPESKEKDLKIIPLDVTSEDSIRSSINLIIKREGKIDVLINNAAIGLIGPIDSFSKLQVKNIFEVNVLGALNVTQEVVPHMRTQNSGQIIFMSSSSGIESSSFLGIYSATKFAIEAIASSLATTLFPWNIRVSTIQPGAMATNFCKNLEKGEFYSEKNDPYKNFTQRSIDFIKKILQEGQDTNTVAKIISNHILNEDECYRIQTSEYANMIAKKYLKDSTGKQFIQEHRDFIKSWF